MDQESAAKPGPGDRTRPRKRRRLWRRLVFVPAVIVVVAFMIALLAVHTPPGRRAVLGRVSATIEERLGVSISADDFSIAVLGGVLEIEGLTLRAAEPGAPPFATVPRARVDFRWGALFGDVTVIDSVQLERPHVDLGAPLPRFGSGKRRDRDDGSAGKTIELPEIVLLDGTIQGTLPATWNAVGEAWSGSRVALRASWSGDMLRVPELEGRVKLEGTRRPAVEAALTAKLTLDSNAVLDVESLELTADGLSAEAGLLWDLMSRSVHELRVELDVEPARLFLDLTSGGHLTTSALLAIEDARVTGSLRANVEHLPAELLSPVLDLIGLEGLDLTDSWLDIDADLEIFQSDSFLGHADVEWRRPQERLLTASLRAVPPRETFGIAFDAKLLPDDPGRRHVEGVLTAPSLQKITAGRLRDARFALDLPDLGDAARRLGFGTGDIGGWRAEGELSASGAVAGPLRTPRIELSARWSRDGVRLVEFDAATQLPGTDEATSLAFDAALLPQSPGRRHAAGELRIPDWTAPGEGELSQTRIVLDLPDIADAIEEFETLSVELFPGLALADRIPEADWLHGEFRADIVASGALSSPMIAGNALWSPATGEIVWLEVDGVVGIEQPFLNGSAALDVEGLDIVRLIGAASDDAALQGRFDAALQLTGSDSGELAAELSVAGRDLLWGGVALDRLALSARGNADAVEVSRIEGAFHSSAESIESRFLGHADFVPSWPPTTAALELEVIDPVEGVERARLVTRLADGILHVDPLELTALGHPATLSAALPLSVLSADLAARVGPGERHPLRLQIDDMELATLLSLARPEDPLPLRGRLDGSLEINTDNVLASTGTLEIEGLAFGTADEVVESDATLRLRIDAGRLVLEPTDVDASGPLIGGRTPLRVGGAVDLDTDWKPEDGLTGLISDLTFDFGGSVDAELLKRFVAADHVAGHVEIEATARGPLEALTAAIHVRGPEARLTYRTPYPALIEAPDIRLRIQGDKLTLESATGRINGGSLRVGGEVDTKTGAGRMSAAVDGARFRVDYGLTAVLDADLEFTWRSADRGRLSGTAVIERGVLRRDLILDREVLRMLAESSIIRSDNPLRDRIDLDLRIDTAEGVNIRNNVADIHINWGVLAVGGTLANPTLDGRIDVDPGGWLWILGQTWRVEEVALEWSGGAISDGRVVFEATSSAQDPSLKQKSRGFWHAGLGDQGPGTGGSLDFSRQATGQSMEQATAELATYYQNRLAGALGAGLNTALSYEPLPLLGETDSQARFTVAQQLSSNFTFIASTNPREAESQSYIVDMPGVPPWPGFRTQLFTNDLGNKGVTLQQTLRLGGGSGVEDSGPRLGKTIVEVSGAVKTRKVKRASGYRKGDPFPPGAALDVEVDVLDWIGREGYPAAEVEVDVEPTRDRDVNLYVVIEPGSRVRYAFEGEKLPRAARRDIAALYHPEASLDSVIARTVRVMHGLGYLDPQVEARLESDDDGQLLRVTTSGGRKIAPGPLRIPDIPDEDAERVAAGRFGTLGARVELAAGMESADRKLLRAFRDLGWPEATLDSRELSEDGELLTVRVTPGRRQHVASIEIMGIDSDEAQRLAEVVQIAVGDVADSRRIVLSSRSMEDDLRGRGYAAARVRAIVGTDDPFELDIRFAVDPGPGFRLAAVRFEGLRTSKSEWIERTAGLEPGGVLSSEHVADARRRLYRTGVFKRIDVTTSEDAETSPAGTAIDTTVTFELQESSRYQLSYGGRAESGRGFSGVVDVVDTHSLGRGHTSGVRMIYGEEKKRLRLYHLVPGVIGPKSTLEFFVEGRDDVEEFANIKGIESWAQLTFRSAGRHQMRAYAVIEHRDVTPLNPAVPVDDLVLSPRLGWQIVFSGIDTAIEVEQRKGTFIGLDISGSSKTLGSDVSSFAAFGQFKWFVPFRKFSWAQSWRIGLQEAIEAEIPFVDRLRAGGEYSVRGYPTNTLGPLDPSGVALGGEVQFVVNQELHRRIWHGLYGLVFFDAGNVWLDRDSVDSELFKSTGVGLRYASPVGPLRLDVGFPLDKRPGDPDSEIYLGFGMVF